MSLNAQFIAVTTAAPEDQRGTSIGLYYLSQQLGLIFGIGGFASLLEKVFCNKLLDALKWIPGKDEVSARVLYLDVVCIYFSRGVPRLSRHDC